MFWKNFIFLCNKEGKTPNGVARELGFSSAAATAWKDGSTHRDTALYKIADYFGVQISYFKDEANPEIDDITTSEGTPTRPLP